MSKTTNKFSPEVRDRAIHMVWEHEPSILRLPKPKNVTMPCWTRQPWPHNFNQTASGKPGAVQPTFRSRPKSSFGGTK
ncbi:hypothetical protein [Brucella intermedia]|uniref:hypothetical protein n=1 Tax=Brucella intermedia TaxID=94625 RepID=UPI0015926069|nr:hypothetical protein [Brucella intermedia]